MDKQITIDRTYVPDDEWVERRPFTKEEKEMILKGTKGKCACCGRKLTLKTMTVEHIIPIYRHGTNDMKNLTALCEQCNKDKGNLMYLPRSFYTAMKKTSKIEEMDDMVRDWIKDHKNSIDIERFPLIAPKHNFTVDPTKRRNISEELEYNRQLTYTWTLVGSEDFEEVEAVTGVSLKVTRDLLRRTRPGMAESDVLTHPQYEVFKPVAFYALRKLSNGKILAVAGVRYDKDKKDLVIAIPWMDISKKSVPMVVFDILQLSQDAIENLACEKIDRAMVLSYNEMIFYSLIYMERCLTGGFLKECINIDSVYFVDELDNRGLHGMILRNSNGVRPITSDFLTIPKWLKLESVPGSDGAVFARVM